MYYDEALAIHREIGYQQGVANHLGDIGLIYSAKGEPGKALKYFEDALAMHREIGYQQGVGSDLGNIGMAYCAIGDHSSALQYFEEALAIHREAGHKQGVVSHLTNMGMTLMDMGKHEQAAPKLAEALTVSWAARVADGSRLVLSGLVRCEDELGRKRMEGLFKDAGFDGETIAGLLKAIDHVRSEMGKAKK
jgi:tetratricopeptide (TPR) repeat protein